ncbi:hypothetical protein H5V45_01890 [Nocardioides sp. KIGAM211]|uniref:Glycosyl hydrolase family 30 TIM-barrel domain-containing protein n=1 Tax=Nocardioides luti TaxID=2761101 RepID=A0A7X0RD42_9ACTN|nr:hypothetical protein [Nocardioides luti]
MLAVSPELTHQTWIGAGAALTDASAGILASNHEATAVLFDPGRADGAHLNLVRLPLSATDFSTAPWAFGWSDSSGTLDVPSEAVTSTEVVSQRLMSLRPDLQLVAVPWTAPASMKDSGALNGGALTSASLGAYGRLLLAQADWLRTRGMPVLAMTLGNEPFHSSASYPTMTMSDAQMISLAKTVGAGLEQRGVQLWSVDHNWSHRGHYDVVQAGAPGMFAAAAFHCYGGSPSQMAGTSVPSVVTECTGTDDGFAGTFRWDMDNLVAGAIDAGSTGLMMWNLALDEQHGPHTGGCATCRGVVDVDSQTAAVSRGPEFFTLAHLSRAADPGAVVIDSSPSPGVSYAAFRNPDGEIGIVGHNDTGSSQVFSIEVGGAASGGRFLVGPGELFTMRGQSAVTEGTVTLPLAPPVVGVPVEAVVAGWQPQPVDLHFQWQAGGSPIAGADGPSFTPTPEEVGQRLSLQVTGSRPGWRTAIVVASTAEPVRASDLGDPSVVDVVPPAVLGSPRVGRTLNVDPGTWSPAAQALAYQWYRDGVPVPGATSSFLTLQPRDLGSRLSVRVRASAPGHADGSVTTSSTGPVALGALTVLDRGLIRGRLQVGSVLRLVGRRSDPAAAASFQWLADGRPLDRSGARRQSHRLTTADLGSRMSVRLTLTSPGYAAATYRVSRAGHVVSRRHG